MQLLIPALDNCFLHQSHHIWINELFSILSNGIHWGRDKIAAILQWTFSNEFSWMNCTEVCSYKGSINNIAPIRPQTERLLIYIYIIYIYIHTSIGPNESTHGGVAMYIWFNELRLIDPCDGLLLLHCQAIGITWTSAWLLSTGPMGTNFYEIWINL